MNQAGVCRGQVSRLFRLIRFQVILMLTPMQYISTRGSDSAVSFSHAVMTGLARDGGLLVPASIPDARPFLNRWKSLRYPELAFEVIRLFADLPDIVLRDLIHQGLVRFRHPDITPVRSLGDIDVLELFHGPTLAFKDLALQFLGALFEHLLTQNNSTLNLIAATSGDTGSAAIDGVRGRSRIRIFVMHPHGRVSPIQERQMTTVLDANVFNLAIRGTFDDCQNILKDLFNDLEFRDRYRLGAVNSINWARILAQIVYFFYGAFRVMERRNSESIQVAVPTGNFGDVFAGYVAARMGLPIRQLIVATNENDILARYFQSGTYGKGPVHATLSPSMDIQVASNFERYLFYRLKENPVAVTTAMQSFRETGILVIPPEDGVAVPGWTGGRCDRAQTLEVIRRFDRDHGYCLDPHTAVGIEVGQRLAIPQVPLMCLATAHPSKFPDAVQAATGHVPALPPPFEDLMSRPTRCVVLPAETHAVRALVTQQNAGC